MIASSGDKECSSFKPCNILLVFLSSFCYMVPIIYTFKHFLAILANAQNQEWINKTIAYQISIYYI